MADNVTLGHLRQLAQRVDGLLDGLEGNDQAFSQVVEEIEGILNRKQDVHEPVEFTIPASGWVADKTYPKYPNAYDVPVSGLTAKDVVSVTADPNSEETAQAAGFMSVQSCAGYFRLRCKTVPTAAIPGEYHIKDGAVNTDDLSVDGAET